MSGTLEWIREFEDELDRLLEKDPRLVYEMCGIDTLIRLWETVPSLSLYMSTKSLDALKKSYIRKHYDGDNVKYLCALLGVSERFVYGVLEGKVTK